MAAMASAGATAPTSFDSTASIAPSTPAQNAAVLSRVRRSSESGETYVSAAIVQTSRPNAGSESQLAATHSTGSVAHGDARNKTPASADAALSRPARRASTVTS